MNYKLLEFEKIIYRGNLARDFFLFWLQQNRKKIKYIFIHIFYFILFKLNKITKEQYYISYFSFLKEDSDLIINQFWDTHKNRLNERMLKNFDLKECILISALPLELVRPALPKYTIKATDYCFRTGTLSDEIFVQNERKEKLKKLKINTFYGYRKSDEVLFEKAKNAYIYRNFRKIIPYTKKRIDNIFKDILQIIGIMIALSCWILVINFYFSSQGMDILTFKIYWRQISLILLNGIPIFMFLLFLYICTNRMWISFGITNFLVFIMGFVNRTKLIYRDDPFVATDLTLVTEALEMSKRYELRITLFMIGLITFSLMIMFILFLYRSKKKMKVKNRILYALIILLISIVGLKTIYHNESLYNKVGDQSNINIWSETQQYKTRGFIYPFLHSTKISKIKKPENYDEKKVKDILSNYKLKEIPTYENNKKVNVISIMLEAYQDISKFDSVELKEDIYKDFHQIEEESYSGKIISNVFGGGTINTERSYLTGYYQFPSFRKQANSFVQYFNEQGYYTEAMHPIYGWFYNRRNVDEILGFQNFDYYENRFSKIQETFLSDDKFFDYIIKGYEKSVKNKKPYFHFSVTYQNHGPYSTEELYKEEYLERPEETDDASYNMINNYLHGIKDTNKALKKLVEYFKKQNEPVVILIFSDHNPFLGDGELGYRQMGIDMDTNTEEGFLNYYGVPYFIWGNEEAKKVTKNDFVGDAPTISPMFLMPELFETLSWKGNSYLQYLTDLKKQLGVIHTPWYYEKEYTTKLSKSGQEKLEEFFYIEYYWLKHYQGK